MRKALTILLAVALMLSLAACGAKDDAASGNTTTPSGASDTPESQDASSPPPASTPEQTPELSPEPEPEPEPILPSPNVTSPITLDFADITLIEAGVADQVSIKTSEHSSTLSMEEEGSQAVYLMFEIKNTSTEAFGVWDYFAGSITVGKYTYKIDNINGVNGSELAPLKSAKFAAYALIPNELIDSGEPYVFTIGFKELFDTGWNTNVADCEYQYTYTVVKNGDVYDINEDAVGASVEADAGEADAGTAAEPSAGNRGSLWEQSFYVDQFNQSTDEAFIMNNAHMFGTFSNSATTDSLLYADILVDAENITIMLYEYGRNLVKNSSTRYDVGYDIKMKTADGTTHDFKGFIWTSGDRIVIEDSYRDELIAALSADPVGDVAFVSFYIVQTDRPTTNYLFVAPMSNFVDVYPSLAG